MPGTGTLGIGLLLGRRTLTTSGSGQTIASLGKGGAFFEEVWIGVDVVKVDSDLAGLSHGTFQSPRMVG